jgi:ribosomal protein S18 acetylase RimI-like enzyme
LLQIRPLKTTDFHSILGLTAEEHWGFGTRDLKRMKILQPGGCLVARKGDEPIGFTMAISYGRNLGWIGNVVVSKKHRGTGIAGSLVQHAVKFLLQRRVKRIGLFSYPENEAMYKRLGFETTNVFVTLSVRDSKQNFTRTIERIPFGRILRLDKRAFGADRSRLLRQLHREFPERWAWIVDHARVFGYSVVKQYEDSSEVGPLVCEQMNKESIGALLRSSIARTEKWPLEMSVPVSSPTVAETAESLGFRPEKKGVVMSYARLERAVIGPAIGALGFLDKG